MKTMNGARCLHNNRVSYLEAVRTRLVLQIPSSIILLFFNLSLLNEKLGFSLKLLQTFETLSLFVQSSIRLRERIHVLETNDQQE